MNRTPTGSTIMFLVLVLGALWPEVGRAQDDDLVPPTARPTAAATLRPPGPAAHPTPRDVVLAFAFPRRTIDPTESVHLDLIVKNNGLTDETVLIGPVETPAGFDVSLRKTGQEIGGVFVAAKERESLTLLVRSEGAEPDPGMLAPGAHNLVLRAYTEDGAVRSTARCQLTVRETPEDEGLVPDAVRVTTAYPSLRGAADSTFKFAVEIRNGTDVDDMFHLKSQAPKGWKVSFKPSYENKVIASLKIEANQSKSIDVEVDPGPEVPIARHDIVVGAESANGQGAVDLEVEITGTYKLQCKTLNEVLSLAAPQGGEARVSMYVVNEGTAPVESVEFASFKPENWDVEFDPKVIEVIEPNKMEQVDIVIKTAMEALVGDYSVAVSARSQGEGRAKDDLELRVTVRASTVWAWIGVALIISVMMMLALIFNRFGRR